MCAALTCVSEPSMNAWFQPTERRQKRAHNPFTAEEKSVVAHSRYQVSQDAEIVRFVTTDGLG
jgi:hypothetical protein